MTDRGGVKRSEITEGQGFLNEENLNNKTVNMKTGNEESLQSLLVITSLSYDSQDKR